jgi:hypothetical protein
MEKDLISLIMCLVLIFISLEAEYIIQSILDFVIFIRG